MIAKYYPPKLGHKVTVIVSTHPTMVVILIKLEQKEKRNDHLQFVTYSFYYLDCTDTLNRHSNRQHHQYIHLIHKNDIT